MTHEFDPRALVRLAPVGLMTVLSILHPQAGEVEDNEHWHYAINTSLNPSDVLHINQLQAQGMSGKWLVFVPAAQLEGAWERVKAATVEGRLGQSSKVARQIRPGQDPVMCVYTKDWSDHGDLARVLGELRGLGFGSHLSYKEDIATHVNLYKGTTNYPASMYVAAAGATTFTRRRPDVATILGVTPAEVIAQVEDERDDELAGSGAAGVLVLRACRGVQRYGRRGGGLSGSLWVGW